MTDFFTITDAQGDEITVASEEDTITVEGDDVTVHVQVCEVDA